MKSIILIFSILLITYGCSSQPNANAIQTAIALTQMAQPTNTIIPSSTALPDTAVPTITNTPQPTNTPLPTSTPKPSSTATLIPTPTATQAPLVFSGQGDDVIDLNKWAGPAILDVKYTGSHNFIIQSDDANGNMIDLLVNTIGSYSGKLPLDFLDSESTARLEITASGGWEITISPLGPDTVNSLNIPGKYNGTGDDVVRLTGATPNKATFDCPGQHNFIVFVYSHSSGKDLLVNAIAPYSGTKAIPSDAFLIVVNANGIWSADFK